MSVEKHIQRKAVQITWDVTQVHGKWATVEGKEEHGFEEKLQVPNDGDALVTYGEDFVGESELRVTGSKGGTDEGIIHVD